MDDDWDEFLMYETMIEELRDQAEHYKYLLWLTVGALTEVITLLIIALCVLF